MAPTSTYGKTMLSGYKVGDTVNWGIYTWEVEQVEDIEVNGKMYKGVPSVVSYNDASGVRHTKTSRHGDGKLALPSILGHSQQQIGRDYEKAVANKLGGNKLGGPNAPDVIDIPPFDRHRDG